MRYNNLAYYLDN